MAGVRRRPAGGRGRRPGAAKPPGRHVVLRIDALGAQGDGVGLLDGRPVFVPLATAGDLVEVEIEGAKGEGLAGRLLALREAGPGRATPPCGHFGDCGGCAVQHLDADSYAGWKAALLPSALARRGLADVPLRPMIQIPSGTRRRADLAAQKRGGRVLLGFHARARHRVVDLRECLVLLPSLVALLAPLRAVLAAVLPDGGGAEILLVQTETGPDLLMTSAVDLTLDSRLALSAFAEAQDLARLSWARPGDRMAGDGTAEPLALRRAPVVRFGGVAVTPPPGPFLQPSADGEAALSAVVLEGLGQPLGPGRRIADLYAGCGTFSLPLAAAGARVHAVDGAGAALGSLLAAARAARLGPQVTTERRDLDDRPLLPAELAEFDAVVFDPPRAGAWEQAAAHARSKIACAVAVSCNPATFARDARALVDAGFRLDWVQPVDQFPWTGHLELVAAFRR
jgi:23S rRNA (uracil1939-C5)-methyltransferase